jgi:predicted transcriptional regulator
MVVKTLKMPKSLSARIQRQARATKRTASAVMREALERGLGEDAGIDMSVALKDFIGSASGPGDLSTNKAYFNDYGRTRHR